MRKLLALICLLCMVPSYLGAMPAQPVCFFTSPGVCTVVSSTNPLPITTSGGGGGGGVTSFTGDGALLNNSASTGAVTATLGNAAAYSLWGNATGASAAPGYTNSPTVLSLTTSVGGTLMVGGNASLAGTTTFAGAINATGLSSGTVVSGKYFGLNSSNQVVLGTGGASGGSSLSSLTSATATNTIDNANFAQAWSWNTLTTQTAMALTSTGITSGKVLDVEATNAGGTGYAGYFSNTATGSSAYAFYGNGRTAIASTSTTALTVGANGATNPVLQIDDSTASVATGVAIKGAATGGGVSISALDSATNGNLNLNAQGSGSLNLNPSTTNQGAINIGNQNTPSITLQVGANNVNINGFGAATFQFFADGQTNANRVRFLYAPGGDNGLTASTNAVLTSFAGTGIVEQHNTGALTLQSDFSFGGTTDSFVAASTLTDGATMRVLPKGCGTNATCTNESAIYVPTLALTATGVITNSYALNVAAATGATNNYAATFKGDITFTGTAPTVSSCGSGAIVTGSTDHKGQISGITAATACTITFSQALAAAPACVFNTNSAIVPTISAISTSAVTSTMTALTGTLYYVCF